MEWIITLGGVLAYDAWLVRTGRNSLSETYSRALANPAQRPFVLTATVLLLLHLTDPPLPPWVKKFDPLAAAARQIRR
jgi:hypothetical protein